MTVVRKQMDRRALFASGAAATLLAATGLSAEHSPTRGGRLRIATADALGVMSVARMAVFDTLTEVAPDGVLRGELATSWQGSTDARHWLFDLRADAVFHDGRPLEAAHAMAVLAAGHDPVARAIADMRTSGQILEITLHEGDADFPYRLSDPALAIGADGPVPEAMENWVGTGLYRLTGASQGRHFLGRRMDGHYKDGQAGWFDAVEAIAISDAAVRAEALRDEFVDVIETQAGIQQSHSVIRPRSVSTRQRLDDWRIAERWWTA